MTQKKEQKKDIKKVITDTVSSDFVLDRNL